MRSMKMLVLMAAALVAVGCSSKKRVEGQEVPVQAQSQEQVNAPAPAPAEKPEMDKYKVAKGDSLWNISGKSAVYNDPFQWPLIFKANRDQIQDPDIIEVGQEFGIRRDMSQPEIDKARKAASDTPKYVPHTKPRETLPVDYF